MHAIRANPTWRCVVRAPRSTCRTLARRSQSSQADSTTYATGLRHVETNLYSTPRDDWSNIPASIVERTARQLHRIKGHPLHTLKSLIEQHFNNDPSILNQASTKSHDVRPHYAIVDALPPVVSVQQNFDSLDIPAGHVSRSKNDTYYVDRERLLRTHTSAHQVDLLRDCQGDDVGDRGFLMTADVYRRDEIDSCHYPVFHQMEGVRALPISNVFPRISAEVQHRRQYDRASNMKNAAAHAMPHQLDIDDFESMDSWTSANSTNPIQQVHMQRPEAVAWMAKHLKGELESMVRTLFSMAPRREGDGASPTADLPIRWVDAYFPFTSPSWEMEVYYRGTWMEVLGCGIMQDSILKRAGLNSHIGWAFGLGLERIAMCLYDIPDIRLFWSTDPRFLGQFQPDRITTFVPFSKYPGTYKDISFWAGECGAVCDNDVFEVVRGVAGDLVESVELVDAFMHPKTKRASRCYRVQYRSLERTLPGDEVEVFQQKLAQKLVELYGVEIR